MTRMISAKVMALVVTEAAYIPVLVPEFHGSKKIPPIADGEYDNLYIVSIPWYGKVKTLRFHYGSPPRALFPTELPPADEPLP